VTPPVHVVGGGLAGAECAYQLAQRGVPVILHEMRPRKTTPAHSTGDLAELVCSNSLRSDDPQHPAGVLKREMESFDSLIIAAARDAAVPAGSALAVDRSKFSEAVTSALLSHPEVEVRRQEVRTLPEGEVVVATGPLTSEALSAEIKELLGNEYLYFYDSIAPIVESESLDSSKLYWASRWGKGDADYLNVPLDEEEYLAFHEQLITAEVAPLHDFEKKLFFEGCLPIEELARRGVDTPRFGPMKPVGLNRPDGSRPWAVVQLRKESLDAAQLNLVGFQTRLKWPEQKRIFRSLPGFEKAEFVRLGQVHRNTFVNSPSLLDPFYRVRSEPRLRLAGQLTGVEGYLESAATGLAVGLYIALERMGSSPGPFPPTTALGALARHLTESDPKRFQPANINYGLFAPLASRLPKKQRREAYALRAGLELETWAATHGSGLERQTPSEPAGIAGCDSATL